MGGWRVLIAVVASLAALAPAAWLWSRCAAGPPTASPTPNLAAPLDPLAPQPQLAELREALASERRQRLALAAEVEWLRERIEAFAGSAAPGTPGTSARAAAERLDPEPAEAAMDDDAPSKIATPHPPWFDAAALASHGAPPSEIERLGEIFSESEMQRIELTHRAQREGWNRNRRYNKAIKAQQQQLREEIGDETYDLLLYATGRSNRVVLSDVLSNSPAERAGLQAGDAILSYDGERVFASRELLRATTQGELGESVAVEVLRRGEVMRLYAPRGALGARLRQARRLPENRW
jgi:hypothetical protein